MRHVKLHTLRETGLSLVTLLAATQTIHFRSVILGMVSVGLMGKLGFVQVELFTLLLNSKS